MRIQSPGKMPFWRSVASPKLSTATAPVTALTSVAFLETPLYDAATVTGPAYAAFHAVCRYSLFDALVCPAWWNKTPLPLEAYVSVTEVGRADPDSVSSSMYGTKANLKSVTVAPASSLVKRIPAPSVLSTSVAVVGALTSNMSPSANPVFVRPPFVTTITSPSTNP